MMTWSRVFCVMDVSVLGIYFQWTAFLEDVGGVWHDVFPSYFGNGALSLVAVATISLFVGNNTTNVVTS